jgi:hypothetical protein
MLDGRETGGEHLPAGRASKRIRLPDERYDLHESGDLWSLGLS